MSLPVDYVVSKFYEYGHRPKHIRYNNTYVCGCPMCGEGKSINKKRRCIYLVKNDVIYCHNCGWSSKPTKWIMTVAGITYDELKAELVAGDFYDSVDDMLQLRNDSEDECEIESLPIDCINLFDSTQVEYYKDNAYVKAALAVIESRRLDTAVNRPKALYISLVDKIHKNRLVIPYFDANGIRVDFYQSRKIVYYDTRERYISKSGGCRSIFNIDRVTVDSDYVFITEGPIDAMFLRNAVAVGGISEGRDLFNGYQQKQFDSNLSFHKKIWVLDSQWLDSTSLKKTEMLLKQGATVYIWPYSTGSKYKDLNEMCVANGLNGIRYEFIMRDVYEGNRGLKRLEEVKQRIGDPG